MNKSLSSYFVSVIAVLIFASATIWLGYYTNRTQWQEVFSLIAVMTLMYMLIATGSRPLVFLLISAAVIRLTQVFYFPNLSDDIFRFIWDGRLSAHGFNPYLRLPSEIMAHHPQPPGMDAGLFGHLNSPEYYTVYPPLMQGIYAIAAILSPSSLTGTAIWIKVFHTAADCGSMVLICKLLRNMKLPLKNALLYAFNPLVIMELSGNAHPEAIMIFFLLFFVYSWQKGRMMAAAVFFALAVSAKLIPLILLPLLIRPMGWRPFIRFALTVVGVNILLAVPFLNATLIGHLFNSIGLYFHSFEFNAGLYYLVRSVGFVVIGHNINHVAAPALALLAGIAILALAYFKKSQKPPLRSILWAMGIYLMCSAIVHPWYLSTLVAFAALCTLRFPLWWSIAALMSYFTYAHIPYRENLWLVFVEYLILAAAIFWDIFGKKRPVGKLKPGGA